MRRAGYEAIDDDADGRKGKKNTAGNTAKLENSLARTKAKIFELAVCNDWEYFVTLTLNPEYHDRKDLDTYKKKLSTWLKNYNRLHSTNIKYLLIPEEHKNGCWHMHGLFMGLPESHLQPFTITEKIPKKILKAILQGHTIYNWSAYAKAFGYLTLSKIINLESVSKYITKYITKHLLESRISLNNHLYYASHGLNRAQTILTGHLTRDLDEDFENDYIKVKTFKNIEDAICYFTDGNQ